MRGICSTDLILHWTTSRVWGRTNGDFFVGVDNEQHQVQTPTINIVEATTPPSVEN
jgi:hypothetical protein